MPKRKPRYQHHKASGQARARIDGRDYYLGPYGSPESRDRYDDLIAEWLLTNGDTVRYTLTVDDLCILYMEHADGYYRIDGKPTTEVGSIRQALRPLIQSCGATRAREFGPLKLKGVRSKMIDSGHVRTSINRRIERIRQMFKWATSEELLPVSVHTTLMTVPGLRRGRTPANESEPVKPVADGDVDATLPYLPPVVADMIRLQVLTGCRPGELTQLRPCNITFGTTGVWTYRPARHKNLHRGKDRRIFIGPEGQTVLRPYLDRDPNAFCFSPKESESARNSVRKQNRKSPMTPSQSARKPKASRKRPVRDRYNKDSYNRAIARACKKARVEPWSPNRLRHSRATAIREQFGIEAAQVVLGHSDAKTTEIYAERDFEAATRIMREIG
jgi:integrase